MLVSDLKSRQIIALARDGMSAAEIAVELETDEAEVRLTLNANQTGAATDRDINDEQLAILRQNAYNLAVGAEDEGVQARLTMFLLERDKPKLVKEPSGAIGNINNAVILAQQSFNELMKKYAT